MSLGNPVPVDALGPALLAAVPQMRTANSSSSMVWVLAAVGLLIVLVVTLSLLNRLLQRWKRTSQAGLFAGLCTLHGLPRGSRRLLKQVAAAGRLTAPARLFTEPQWLEVGARSPQFQARAAELTALHDRLFGPTQEGTG